MPKIIENIQERVLSELERMFVDGTEDISIRTLARRANVAVGTIYNYFPDKDELVKALFQREWESVIDQLKQDIQLNESFHANTGFPVERETPQSAATATTSLPETHAPNPHFSDSADIGVRMVVEAVYSNAERVAGGMHHRHTLIDKLSRTGGRRASGVKTAGGRTAGGKTGSRRSEGCSTAGRRTMPYPFRQEGWNWLADRFQPVWQRVFPDAGVDRRRLTITLVSTTHRLLYAFPDERDANVQFLVQLILEGAQTGEFKPQ